MNRKTFFATSILVVCANSSHAQSPSIALSLKEPFDSRLKIAQTKLERGQYLNNVILLLESCIKEKPDRYDLHLYLACANAGRAHILAKAQIDSFQREKRLSRYEQDMTDWKNAQNHQESVLYGIPKPSPLATVHTIDDKAPFTLSLDETKKKIESYSKRALSEISAAEKLLPPDSEKDEAQYHYISAWIQAILWRYPQSLTKNIFPSTFKPDMLISIIEKLYKYPTYESKSKLIVSDYITYINDYHDFDIFNRGSKIKLVYDSIPELGVKSVRLFREYMQTAEIQSPLFALRLSVLNQDIERLKWLKTHTTKGDFSGSLEESEGMFSSDLSIYKEIANNNQNNAIIWYLYACKLLSNNKIQECRDAVHKGNMMQAGGFPEYRLSAPKSISWAVPLQILVPKDSEILISSIINDYNSNSDIDQQLMAFKDKIITCNKIDESIENDKLDLENKNKILTTSHWMKNLVFLKLSSFVNKNPDIILPEEIMIFIRKNSFLWNQVERSTATFKKLNGDPQNQTQRGKE